MKQGYIHSLESFGTVDGPGIRFVVFFQGCNLRCLYCHNPDTWQTNIGQKMSVDQILNEYEKVKEFITGGITITGGDPLLQLPFLIELLKEAKRRNIHTCLDTSGGIYNKNNKELNDQLLELIKYVDLVLLDLKHINDEQHIKLTGISNEGVLDFARFLSNNHVSVWIRHVIIPTITFDQKYLYQLGSFIGTLNNVDGIEVLPYHTMAKYKYEQLKMVYPLEGIKDATKEEADYARKIILFAYQKVKKTQMANY